MTESPYRQYLMDEITMGSPVAKGLGLELVKAAPELTVLRLPFRPGNTTFEDVIHGGTIATLIDIAAAAGFVAGSDDGMVGGVTSALSINYLSAARGCDLVAETRPLRRGRSQTTCEVTVLDTEGHLIAKGTVTNRGFAAPVGTA